MQKEKIMGLNNTEDSKWYKLNPCNKTLEILDKIFDLYDYIYEENSKDLYDYKFCIDNQERFFLRETEDFIAYFLLTKKQVHLILRKTLNWKKIDEEIKEKFEFKE
jgi:hypothetical protein